jgi:hypothetical protein
VSSRWMDNEAEPLSLARAFAATEPRPGRDLVSVLERIERRRETRQGLMAGSWERMVVALDVLHDPDLTPDEKVERTRRVLVGETPTDTPSPAAVPAQAS